MKPPSPRVQLEVALLAEQAGTVDDSMAARDEHTCLTVLVVAAEPDFRHYVRECLRERADLRLLDAATITSAVDVAANNAPGLLVVDDPERDVLVAMPRVRAIVVVDEVAHGQGSAGTHVRLLPRPFTARELLAEVQGILS